MKYIRGCKIDRLGIADDFYEAYIKCLKTNNDNPYVVVPAFVNGLFSCELYLKSILNTNNKGHNLKELFDLLDKRKQKELEDVECDERYTLELLLNGIGNGFEVWRYCFEDEHKDFEEKYPFEYTNYFLKTYLPVLKRMAQKYYNETK